MRSFFYCGEPSRLGRNEFAPLPARNQVGAWIYRAHPFYTNQSAMNLRSYKHETRIATYLPTLLSKCC